MRLTRMKAAVAAGVLAVSGTVTATALAVVPASAASSPVVVVSCAGHGLVPSRRLRHRLHRQRAAALAALANLARHRLRERRAQGGRLHADVRAG